MTKDLQSQHIDQVKDFRYSCQKIWQAEKEITDDQIKELIARGVNLLDMRKLMRGKKDGNTATEKIQMQRV